MGGPRGVEVADGDAGDLEPGPGLHGQGVGPVLEDAHQGAPDVAAAEDGDTQVRSAGGAEVTRSRYRLGDATVAGRPTTVAAQTSRRTRSSSVSRRTTARAVPPATKSTAGRGTLL